MSAIIGCIHDWKIWPETDGQEQKCMNCGAYRQTPLLEWAFDKVELPDYLEAASAGEDYPEPSDLAGVNRGLREQVEELCTTVSAGEDAEEIAAPAECYPGCDDPHCHYTHSPLTLRQDRDNLRADRDRLSAANTDLERSLAEAREVLWEAREFIDGERLPDPDNAHPNDRHRFADRSVEHPLLLAKIEALHRFIQETGGQDDGAK